MDTMRADARIQFPTMLAHPRVGLFVALSLTLAASAAILIVGPDLLWACAAPERYLEGAREFVGPSYVTDDLHDLLPLPTAVLAWRRLAEARDTMAFAHLATARSPAARLYGLSGLRLLAPPLADLTVKRMEGSADSVYVNWACAERTVPLSAAVRELDLPGWGDTLLSAVGMCR